MCSGATFNRPDTWLAINSSLYFALILKMNGETNDLEHFESVDDYNKFKDIFYERKGVK